MVLTYFVNLKNTISYIATYAFDTFFMMEKTACASLMLRLLYLLASPVCFKVFVNVSLVLCCPAVAIACLLFL